LAAYVTPSVGCGREASALDIQREYHQKAADFVDRVVDLMQPMVGGYQREGRRYVTLAVGCTGGKHRSVAIAETLAARLNAEDVATILVHRDLGRE